jgi:hypothetical protein
LWLKPSEEAVAVGIRNYNPVTRKSEDITASVQKLSMYQISLK